MEPTQVAVVEPRSAASALTLVRPIAQPTDLIAYHAEVAKVIQSGLTEGVDYGVVPGTGDKPSLFKPGAERINLAFGAAPEYEIIEKEIEHEREVRWTKRKKKWNNRFHGDKTYSLEMEEGNSLGLYRYVIRCKIVRGGRLLAECIGTCSTLESKYIDRPRDCENTTLKMAQKRAYVGATLHAYGLSNRFTQDVEDLPRDTMPAEEFESPPPPAAPPPAAEKKPGAGYNGSKEHKEALTRALSARKVPESVWAEVDEAMMGLSFLELDRVLQEIRARPVAATGAQSQ